jgi:hypothetical protein
VTDNTQVVPAGSISVGEYRAAKPQDVLEYASTIAKPLAELVEKRKLYSLLQGKKFVKVEGWTTLGAMLGVVPREIEVTEVSGVFTAMVELYRMSDGAIIGRASAECGSEDEVDRQGKPTWASRPRYARRSMALTRATGKAFRLSFSWIMQLAGFEPTPAEEIDHNAEPPPPENAGDEPRQAIRGFAPKVRPYAPEMVKAGVLKKAEGHAKSGRKASDKQRALVAMLLSECFEGDEAKRHSVVGFLFEKDSLAKDACPDWNILALLDWMKPEQDTGGSYAMDGYAVKEAHLILEAARISAGEQPLPLEGGMVDAAKAEGGVVAEEAK